jgi:hypothetical protein
MFLDLIGATGASQVPESQLPESQVVGAAMAGFLVHPVSTPNATISKHFFNLFFVSNAH